MPSVEWSIMTRTETLPLARVDTLEVLCFRHLIVGSVVSESRHRWGLGFDGIVL